MMCWVLGHRQKCKEKSPQMPPNSCHVIGDVVKLVKYLLKDFSHLVENVHLVYLVVLVDLVHYQARNVGKARNARKTSMTSL